MPQHSLAAGCPQIGQLYIYTVPPEHNGLSLVWRRRQGVVKRASQRRVRAHCTLALYAGLFTRNNSLNAKDLRNKGVARFQALILLHLASRSPSRSPNTGYPAEDLQTLHVPQNRRREVSCHTLATSGVSPYSCCKHARLAAPVSSAVCAAGTAALAFLCVFHRLHCRVFCAQEQ